MTVTVRIEVFNVFLVLGQDIFLDGLYLIEAVRPGGSRTWTDAVGTRFTLVSSMYPSDADFQRCFEQLYGALRDKMRDRLKAELSP